MRWKALKPGSRVSSVTALPLQGKCYLLTRAPHQVAALEQLLHPHGAKTLTFPTLDIQVLKILPEMLAHLEQKDKRVWWAFNSANTVSAVMEQLDAVTRVQVKARVSFACVGPKTAEKLRLYDIEPTIMPSVHHAEALGNALLRYFHGHGLLPQMQNLVLWQAEEGLPGLQQVLAQSDYRITVFAVYRTLKPESCNTAALSALLKQQSPQGIIFTSPSSVRHFAECLTPALQKRLHPVDFYSLGPVTSASILQYLGPVAIEAEPHTLDGLVTKLCAFGQQHQV